MFTVVGADIVLSLSRQVVSERHTVWLVYIPAFIALGIVSLSKHSRTVHKKMEWFLYCRLGARTPESILQMTFLYCQFDHLVQ